MNRPPSREAVHELAMMLRQEQACLPEECYPLAVRRSQWFEKSIPGYLRSQVFAAARSLADGKGATNA